MKKICITILFLLTVFQILNAQNEDSRLEIPTLLPEPQFTTGKENRIYFTFGGDSIKVNESSWVPLTQCYVKIKAFLISESNDTTWAGSAVANASKKYVTFPHLDEEKFLAVIGKKIYYQARLLTTFRGQDLVSSWSNSNNIWSIQDTIKPKVSAVDIQNNDEWVTESKQKIKLNISDSAGIDMVKLLGLSVTKQDTITLYKGLFSDNGEPVHTSIDSIFEYHLDDGIWACFLYVRDGSYHSNSKQDSLIKQGNDTTLFVVDQYKIDTSINAAKIHVDKYQKNTYVPIEVIVKDTLSGINRITLNRNLIDKDTSYTIYEKSNLLETEYSFDETITDVLNWGYGAYNYNLTIEDIAGNVINTTTQTTEYIAGKIDSFLVIDGGNIGLPAEPGWTNESNCVFKLYCSGYKEPTHLIITVSQDTLYSSLLLNHSSISSQYLYEGILFLVNKGANKVKAHLFFEDESSVSNVNSIIYDEEKPKIETLSIAADSSFGNKLWIYESTVTAKATLEDNYSIDHILYNGAKMDPFEISVGKVNNSSFGNVNIDTAFDLLIPYWTDFDSLYDVIRIQLSDYAGNSCYMEQQVNYINRSRRIEDSIIGFPNPFVPSQHNYITIMLQKDISIDSNLYIFDMFGSLVTKVQSRENTKAVFYWDGTRENGRPCPSGGYLAVYGKDKDAIFQIMLLRQ